MLKRIKSIFTIKESKEDYGNGVIAATLIMIILTIILDMLGVTSCTKQTVAMNNETNAGLNISINTVDSFDNCTIKELTTYHAHHILSTACLVTIL